MTKTPDGWDRVEPVGDNEGDHGPGRGQGDMPPPAEPHVPRKR